MRSPRDDGNGEGPQDPVVGAERRELERIVAFQRSIDERRARRAVPFAHGHAYFDDDLPKVWYLNQLSVEPGARPSVDELVAAADKLQAHLEHRKATVYDEALGAQLAPGFLAIGWVAHRLVVMPHRGGGRAVDTSRVAEIDGETLAPTWADGIRGEPLAPDEEDVRQLVAAQLDRRKAVDVRYFAVLENGRPVSYCELFSDGRTGQIESVLTLEEHRGKGYAGAVVAKALAESQRMGHDLTFLLADEDDWPKELYRKLGFEVAGRIFEFVKAQSLDLLRVRALRLRTPRLELRLASEAEIVALSEVAGAGIHPPDEMPFAVAWTDDPHRPTWLDDFLGHYRRLDRERRPDDWTLNLTVFLDGEPIGAQSVGAEGFAEHRLVRTGSWLGAPFQRRGLGTEMRAAVLALAFDGLGATAAESGAIAGNDASARVSEKLGYAEVESGTVSPRGAPVVERRFRLTREAWEGTPHAQVEIDGLEPCLPLLGATSARSR
jgi:RimJ/RimL family protein N-acetyltransferase/predicted GNAT family N-acyltransferase